MLKVLIRDDFQDVVLVQDGELIGIEGQEGDLLVDLGDYNNFVKPIYENGVWKEGATEKEIADYKESIKPTPLFGVDLPPKVEPIDEEKVAMAMAIINLETRLAELEGKEGK